MGESYTITIQLMTMTQIDLARELERLKKELREKWLKHFNDNQDWISVWAANNNFGAVTKETVEPEILDTLSTESQTYTPRTLHSHLIIGFISGLEPNLYALLKMLCFTSHNSNSIVQALELSFDPLS